MGPLCNVIGGVLCPPFPFWRGPKKKMQNGRNNPAICPFTWPGFTCTYIVKLGPSELDL
jgi:hypothetical protein